MHKFENIDQLEEFMLKHGESIVDMMGGEIDRIEMKLRVCRVANILKFLLILLFCLFHCRRSIQKLGTVTWRYYKL